MTYILLGKPVADVIRGDIVERVEKIKQHNLDPVLTIVRIGENANDLSYEKGLRSTCQSVGIDLKVCELPESVTTSWVISAIQELNADVACHGILVFRPLPKHLDEYLIGESIHPSKDVDCMTRANLSKLFFNDFSGVLPATPLAVLKLLDFYNISLEGQHVSIVNRSMVVGKPLAMMLLSKNATVTLCHSRTHKLEEITQSSDIIVLGTGQGKKFGREYFNEKSVVIDVGINEDAEGNLCGDTNFDEIKDLVRGVTPVPRGIGSITNSVLLSQLMLSAENLVNSKQEDL